MKKTLNTLTLATLSVSAMMVLARCNADVCEAVPAQEKAVTLEAETESESELPEIQSLQSKNVYYPGAQGTDSIQISIGAFKKPTPKNGGQH